MRFQPFKDIRPMVFHDLSGQQHPAGLAADHTGADHAGMHLKIIFGREVGFDQRAHLFIPAQHDIAHAAALFRDIDPVFMQKPGICEEALPAVRIPAGGMGGLPVHKSVKMTDLGSFRQHPKTEIFPA